MPPKSRARGGRRAAGSRRQIPASSTVATDPGGAAGAAGDSVPSVDGDIAELAKRHWAGRKAAAWSVEVVRAILAQHIVGAKFARAKLQALERAQYLEQYLWRHYPGDGGAAGAEVVVSVLLMVNEKLQQRLHASAWAVVAGDAGRFGQLFDDAIDLMSRVMAGAELEFIDAMSVRSIVVQFLVGCFGSIETAAVRDCVMPLVSVAIWHHVDSDAARDRALGAVPQLRKFWKHAGKRCRGDAPDAARHRRDRDFVAAVVRDFVQCQFAAGGEANWGAVAYGTKVLELLVDLESQLPTRRYVSLLLADMQTASLCQRSPWAQLAGDNDGAHAALARRFCELTRRLRAAGDAQIRHVTGRALTDAEARDAHHRRLADLQLAAFEHFPRELEALAVSGVARLGDRDVLAGHLAALDRPALLRLADAAGIRHRALVPAAVAPDLVDPDGSYVNGFVVAAFGEAYGWRPTTTEQAHAASPYPTEQLLFSAAVDDADSYERQPHAITWTAGDGEATSVCYPVLAAPKLNMQFLSVHDYLARCFELLQLESAHEIREDIEDAVRRLQPRATHERPDGGDDVSPANTHFAGWARMALPLQSFEVSDVQRPRLGEAAPARVRADISVDLADHAESIRREWDEELRPRDVLILCAAAPPQGAQSQRAVRAVRGCEIECRLDAAGRPLGAGAEADAGPNADDSGDAQEGPTRGSVRRFRVLLDPQQYHADIQAGDGGPYAALNVVVRRRPQESNFKAVLETVRDLMATPPALPDWLAATFLGYGDPAAAAAQAQWTRPGQVWFGDTFVSEDHVRECLAPFRVEFPDGAFATPCVVEFPADAAASAEGGVVRVTHAPAPSMGPAELAPVRANRIRFTAAQVAAIGAAAREGLTMIVGPPGTGKTDVAVQIVANLYHAHPRQKILMITHSNQALNQLFEKIIALDIEPRHLLRLGHGEGALDAEESYSRAGRVDSYLARRAELLADVRALAESLGVAGDDVGYTCANARFFHVVHVRMRWDAFRRAVLDPPAGAPPTADAVRAGFPFTRFFEARLGCPLFAADDDVSAAALAETAAGCFRWLERLFDELADIQPFELLRTRADCANYLLTNQARIVAMTCTHAALKRRDLVRLGFRYDTVVMEEAAQVLDVESFIPLTLRRPAAAATADGAAARELKRLVLIGDHNQLPPVVRSGGLRAFAGMDQSLFARLVRLGVPYIELNRQARARPAIADLYRFRYRDLGDLLPAVASGPFAAPNAALAHSFQFVDVGDFAGRGESEPRRFFYQNLGEAEYVVAAYQYLRLRGYPPERIAILTTYNGQRALIADVLERRCAWLPHFARPAAVSTVDQFQGQQCDIVLLSLVRTRAVGHVRDLRRLTVALSRARLGLYVFGRRALFESCFELAAPVRRLLANGDRLALCPDEAFGAPVPDQRSITTVGGVEELGAIVYKMLEDHLAHNDDPAADEPAAGGAGDSEGQDDASAEAQAAAPESESAPS